MLLKIRSRFAGDRGLKRSPHRTSSPLALCAACFGLNHGGRGWRKRHPLFSPSAARQQYAIVAPDRPPIAGGPFSDHGGSIMPDPLAGLPPRFLRTPEAARFLGLSGRTLEKHRTYGTGPKYRKIGG